MTGTTTRHADAQVQPAPSSFPSRRDLASACWLAVSLLASIAATLYVIYLSWLLTSEPFRMFDGVLSPTGAENLYPSKWLSWGHASIAACFLITNLVNRRYGQQMALAHVLASAALTSFLSVAIDAGLIGLPQQPSYAPALREWAAFITALTLGQTASVVVFDRTRGVEWWNAPAYAALTATLVSMPLFYALAYAGGDWIWLNRMAIDIALKCAAAFALLLPYFLLRPVIRPREGLGGF